MSFIAHLMSRYFTEAFAKNDILQLVVFPLLSDELLAASGEKAIALIRPKENRAEVILKITSILVRLALLVVMAAIASAMVENCLLNLTTAVVFIGGFDMSLVLL